MFARNVLANWCGHFVFLLSGFVIPRLVSDHVGPVRLGIWDFGWAMVGYLNLLTFGVASSVNRYVAFHRAQARPDLLNSAASCCMAVFLGTGTAAVLITIGVCLTLPVFFAESFGVSMREAQWVVLLLGTSASLEMPFSVYSGVITGSLRYGLLNVIKSGCHLLAVVAMVILLLLDRSLVALAWAIFLQTLLSGTLRAVAAQRVCKGLCMSLKAVTRSTLRDVIGFGGKSFLLQMARAIYYQTTSILIVYYLGPSALAIYARPTALLIHALKLVQEFAYVITPTASSMQGAGNPEGLKNFLYRVTEYSFAISLPIVLFIAVLGGEVLHLWMGPGYANSVLIAVLALGHLAVLTHVGTVCFLAGLHAHGRAALTILTVSLCGVAMMILALGVLHKGLVTAAVIVGLSLTIAYGVLVPVVGTRVVGARLRPYVRAAFFRPLMANIPFMAVLAFAHCAGGRDYRLGLLVGVLGGGLTISVTYWLMLLPDTIKRAILRRITALGHGDKSRSATSAMPAVPMISSKESL
jgi:O-antigen/teichoic acid export membrane protein